MTQNSQSGQSAQTMNSRKSSLGIKLMLGLCIIGCFVLPYLHTRFGSTSTALAAATVVANLVVFLATYLLTRRMRPAKDENSAVALLKSLVISLPVFILAFFGLGLEISVIADIAAAYITGIWLGTSEAAELYTE